MERELLGLSPELLKRMAPDYTHQHYKGGLYRYVGKAFHTEDEEMVVIYEHVFPHQKQLYVRPKQMFEEFIDVKTARFTIHHQPTPV